MLAKYRELLATVNDKGEWACAHADVPYLIVGERKDFGVAHSGAAASCIFGSSRAAHCKKTKRKLGDISSLALGPEVTLEQSEAT